MSNEELVKRIKQGEKGLMSELYQNCRSFIIAIIKHIGIEQPEDFEDAMQDSYFGLYEAVKDLMKVKGINSLHTQNITFKRQYNEVNLNARTCPNMFTVKGGKYCVSVRSLCNHSEDTRHTQN